MSLHSEPDSELLVEARAAIRREAAAVEAVADQLDDSFERAVRLVGSCSGKVFVTGAGTSGAVARRMAHLLAVTGTPAAFLPAGDALHGTMGVVTEGDVVVMISKLGGSAEVNDLAQRLLDRGARLLALTETVDAPFSRYAEVTVVLLTPSGADPGDLIAMGSTLAAAAWGDALAQILMRVRGYDWERVLHSHPSGAVGQRERPQALPPIVLADAPAVTSDAPSVRPGSGE